MLGRILLYGFIAIFLLPLLINVFFYFVEKDMEENPVSQNAVNELVFENAQAIYDARCASCHGANGDGAGGYPRINGDSQMSIASKLIGYKNGSYGSTAKGVMELQVQDLTQEQLQEIALHLSTRKPVFDHNETKKLEVIELDYYDISS